MLNYFTSLEFVYIVSFTIGGSIIGIIFETVVLARLHKQGSNSYGVITTAIKGVVTLWFLIAGVYFTTIHIPIDQQIAYTIKQILIVLITLSLTYVIAKVTIGFFKVAVRNLHGVVPKSSIFTVLVEIVFFIVAILFILQSMGISIAPLLTALGVGGVAVALAMQDTLSNLFAGIHLVVSKQIRVGDYVRLDSGEEGYVQDINWRNTTVHTLPNNMIIVPNAKIASSFVTNYYQPSKDMAVLIDIGVALHSDLGKVEYVTCDVGKEVMQTVTGGVPEFTPFIRYHTFGDFAIRFTVILRAQEYVDQYLIKHEFVKRLQQRYEQEGIEIPYPARSVFLTDKTHQ